MQRHTSVPLLPGFTNTHPLPHVGRKAKPQKLVYLHNTAFDHPVEDKNAPTLDHEEMTALMETMKHPPLATSKSESQLLLPAAERQAQRRKLAVPSMGPSWIKHDKQCCRFFGYFQESVVENNTENARFRYVVMIYYLEDGTCEVNEQKIENAGMYQGKMVRRHCIVKPDGSFLSLNDLRCGINLEIYGRVYRIVGCDGFTRWYYAQNGIEAGEEEDAPKDQFLLAEREKKKKAKLEIKAARQIKESQKYNEKLIGGNPDGNLKLEQFLLNDLKVLQFYCYWDDETTYGNRTYYVMSFFLATNEMQIAEVFQRNCGKAKFPLLWKKAKLVKAPSINIYPGMLQADQDMYMPEDFKTGGYFEIYGRKLYIYDCDPFTYQFYLQWNNVKQDRMEMHPPAVVEYMKIISPHIGLGGPEDSLATCYALWPKAPLQEVERPMKFGGKILRFEAKFENIVYEEDTERRFIIIFNLANFNTGVFESRRRNSGFMEGKFADSGKRMNPFTKDYFKPIDFFTGSLIRVSGQTFRILRPDEYTLKYMEQHPADFPYSDLTQILAKISPDALAGKEIITPDELLTTTDLNDQEVITLLRSHGTPGSVEIPVASLMQN